MGIVTGIRAVDKYWLCTNFTQATLSNLYDGGVGIYRDKFKYSCDKSDSTDLNDVYFEITVNAYRDKGGTSPWGKIRCRYKMTSAQMSEITSDNIDEIVIAYSRAGEQSSAEIEVVEDGSDRYFQLVNIGNTIGYFQAFYRDKDGHVVTRVLGDTMDLVNISFSSAKFTDGRWVDGYPREWDGGNVYYAYGWINGNNYSKGAIDGLYFNVAQSTSFRASHLAFANPEDAVNYLLTGEGEPLDEDGEDEDLAEDREVTLYYESDIFSRTYNSSTSTHIGASNIHFRVQYKNNKGEEIVNPYRAICGYVATNNEPNDNNRFGNIIWLANNNINLIETTQHPVSGTITPSKTIPNYNNTTGFYPPYINNTTIYDARYRTNMRIFANEQDALDFLGGGNPTPICESGNKFNPNGFIGDKTVFNDGHDMAGGGMSSCWIMNESQLEDLANVFTTGLTKVEEQNGDLVINITKTCARAFASHGEPIDAVVDLFWIPFDPSEFVIAGASSFTLSQDDLSTATSLLKITSQSGDVVKAHGTRSFGESKEFVGNVVDAMGGMFGSTIQKVQNVGN